MKSIKILPLKKSVIASLSIPGSKSYTNRALLLAALTKNKVTIINPLFSDDTKAMISCLKELDIKILQKKNRIEILNNINGDKNRVYNLNADLSGTTIRFLLALSTIVPGVKILQGEEGLNVRPIGELVKGLRQLGAKIEYLDKKGYPPLKITSNKLLPGIAKMHGDISSQYFSAILMIAPIVGGIAIEIIGHQISKSYIDMTIDTMKQFGVKVLNKKYKEYIIPENQKYNLNTYTVEGDVSSASYFAAIAALTKSCITLSNMNPKSVQGDMEFFKILEKMGNKITYGKNYIKIFGKGIKPINVNMQNCPDSALTLAVLSIFSRGTTKISGIRSLRVKETERIKALEKELGKMNINTSSTIDSLTIYGGDPQPATINTYGDHRLAMAFAVAGSKLDGIIINDPNVVTKTFPDYWKKLNSIGVKTKLVNNKNIVLIGLRGSGKTTIAKLLSKKLNKEYLEVDELIIKKIGLTIPEIIRIHGWDYFRDQESNIVEGLSLSKGKIVSTGGGIITNSKNIDVLRENGIIILLKASVETLLNRIENDPNRPPLTNCQTQKEEIKELLKQRKKLYEKAADKIINTDKLKPIEVANQILLIIKGEKR